MHHNNIAVFSSTVQHTLSVTVKYHQLVQSISNFFTGKGVFKGGEPVKNKKKQGTSSPPTHGFPFLVEKKRVKVFFWRGGTGNASRWMFFFFLNGL